MKNFTYKARNASGKLISGETKVKDEKILEDMLIEKGFTVVDITEKTAMSDLSQLSIFQQSVTSKDLSIFCKQISIILDAGIPIINAMEVLVDQTPNKTLQSRLKDIRDDIQKGVTLSTSMKNKKIFPDMLINMVEAGELSGQLEISFERMAVAFEKEDDLKNKVKGAITYPTAVIIIAILVVVVLMVKVVPSFVDILHGFNVELPAITKILIGVSGFFKSSWYYMLGGLIIASIVGYRYYKSEDGKYNIDSVALKLPVIGVLINKIITARFARTMSTLISSGVLILPSLEILQKILGNAVMKEKFGDVILKVNKGMGLTQPLIETEYFSAMVISMVKIGEESGALDKTLTKCADFYDKEVELGLQQMTSMIEPVVMSIVAVIVAFIVLSILTPMLSIYENFQG